MKVSEFDAIMLDACTPMPPILCPAPDFLNQKTIRQLSSKLKRGGSFTSNVAVIGAQKGSKTLKEVRSDVSYFVSKICFQIHKKYSKHFKTCCLITAENNFVLTCSNDASSHEIKQFTPERISLPLQKALNGRFTFLNI